MTVKSKMDAPITDPRATTPRRGSPEWQRRAEAWAAAHGMPAALWLGPGLDPLPEPHVLMQAFESAYQRAHQVVEYLPEPETKEDR